MKYLGELIIMTIKSKLSVCLIMLACCSCSQTQRTTESESKKEIRITALEIDTVQLSLEETSVVGSSVIYKDSLCFLDDYFSYLYPMDAEGQMGNRLLGKGEGPSELPIRCPLGIAPDPSNNSTLVFLGSSNDFYLYDGNVKRMNMIPDGEPNSYESSSAYTLWDETILKLSGDNMYYNVIGSSEETSLTDQADYPQHAFIMMKVNLSTGKMTPAGHFSDTYVKNWDKLITLPKYYYDSDDQGDFYLSFQADSLLYRMDSDLNVKQAFGFQGTEMETSYYTAGNDLEELGEALQKNLTEKGYYCWIKKVGKYIFRSYQKSEGKFGLQIYEGTTLIGDVETPACLKVAGYVSPYFVSEVIFDEETNTLKFYRFKLDK